MALVICSGRCKRILTWPWICVSRLLSRLRLGRLWSILAFIRSRIVSPYFQFLEWLQRRSGNAACPVFDLPFEVGNSHSSPWSDHFAKVSGHLIRFYPWNLCCRVIMHVCVCVYIYIYAPGGFVGTHEAKQGEP